MTDIYGIDFFKKRKKKSIIPSIIPTKEDKCSKEDEKKWFELLEKSSQENIDWTDVIEQALKFKASTNDCTKYLEPLILAYINLAEFEKAEKEIENLDFKKIPYERGLTIKAFIEMGRRNFDKAISHYLNLKEIEKRQKNESTGLFVNLASAYFNNEQYDLALKEIEEYIEKILKNKKSKEHLINIAIDIKCDVLVKLKRNKDRKIFLKKILKEFPTNASLLSTLGIMEGNDENHEDAEKYFERALSHKNLNDSSSEDLQNLEYNLELSRFKLGKISVNDFLKSKITPEKLDTISRHCAQNKEYEKVINLKDEIISNPSDDFDSLYYLSESMFWSNNEDKTKYSELFLEETDNLLKNSKLSKEDFERVLLQRSIVILHKEKNTKNALNELEKIENPESVEIYFNKIIHNFNLKNHNESNRLFLEFLKKFYINDEIDMSNLTLYSKTAKKNVNIVEVFVERGFADKKGDFYEFHKQVADILRINKKYHEAGAFYSICGISKATAKTCFHLGFCFRCVGNYENAKKLYQQAIELEKDDNKKATYKEFLNDMLEWLEKNK